MMRLLIMGIKYIFASIGFSVLVYLVGCTPNQKVETGLLAYVPAHTPYIYAIQESPSEQLIDRFTQLYEPILPAYQKFIADFMTRLEQQGDVTDTANIGYNKTDKTLLVAFLSRLNKNFTTTGIRQLIGLSKRPRLALYSVDMAPVLRIELANPKQFRQFIADVETDAGRKFITSKVGQLNYWQALSTPKDWNILFALQDTYLIVTIVPSQLTTGAISNVLGNNLPETSLADSGALNILNQEMQFLPYASGYVDFKKLIKMFIDASQNEAQQEFHQKISKYMPEEMTVACQNEFLNLAQHTPRMIFGLTHVDLERVESTSLLEMDAELVADMQKLVTPIAHLGKPHDAMASFGFSLDSDGLASFVKKRAEAVNKNPYNCEKLQPLNQMWPKLDEQFRNPFFSIYMILVNGVFLQIDDFGGAADFSHMLTDLKGKVLISSPNVNNLISTLSAFIPILAELNLENGDEPVAIPDLPNMPPVYVVKYDQALGIGVGEEARIALPVFTQARPDAEAVNFSLSYSGSFLQKYIEMMNNQLESNNIESCSHTEDIHENEQNENDAFCNENSSTEAQRAAEGLVLAKTIYGHIDRIYFEVKPQKKGLAFRLVQTFKVNKH